MKKLTPSFLTLAGGAITIAAFAAVYIWLYQYQPLVQPWNDIWLYAIFVLAAMLAAVAATSVVFQFKPSDKPRSVWLHFAAGLWCWSAAELIWMIYALTVEEPASVSIADVAWSGAYVLFALAFMQQFRLILSPSKKQEARWLVGGLGAILLVTLILTTLLRQLGGESQQNWGETFLVVFYPVGDLAIGLMALRVSQLFGRGQWGRVWWGMIFFTFSDALYSWLDFSGIYALSVESGNSFSLITDVVYISAYLLIALACVSQITLMRYGAHSVKTIEDFD
jgi:hypothetical protein